VIYAPLTPPSDPKDFARWALDEFVRLARNLGAEQDFVWLRPLPAAPSKPREGMVANADGTNWNPGGTGAGLYQYLASAWVKL
jgi:hypothetical protein